MFNLMHKKNIIISLGCDCFSRMCATAIGIKPRKRFGEPSMPFDLSWHPAEALLHYLKTDFKDFFDDITYDDNLNYYINKKYQSLFNHDKDCKNTEKGYRKLINRYKARIKNFKNALQSDKHLFFIYRTFAGEENYCNEIYYFLNEKRQGKKFKLIIIDTEEKMNSSLLNENITLCAIHHPFLNGNEWYCKFNKKLLKKYFSEFKRPLKAIIKYEQEKENYKLNLAQLLYKTLLLIIYRMFENYNINLSAAFIKLCKFILDMRLSNFKKSIKNPVVIVEPTDSHGETIPSVYKYFLDMGLKSDILMLENHRNCKSVNCLKNIQGNVHYVSYLELSAILERGILNNYKIAFFNSFNTYFHSAQKYPSIYEEFKVAPANNFVCGFLHHLDYQKECQENNYRYFALTNLKNEYANENNFINPHYFGDVKITPKNNLTEFIIVGSFEAERRNFKVLLDAVKRLIKEGRKNFKIICIGRNAKNTLSEELSKYFDFKGRLPYPQMYKQMEKADFFLPLLDPENPEHNRYITIGTSGSFQLIYGFQKPCLIHEKFAKHHFLNNNNSLIYSKNEDLYSVMKQAIDMDNNKYKAIQNNLEELSQNLYNKSLENLKTVIKNEKL